MALRAPAAMVRLALLRLPRIAPLRRGLVRAAPLGDTLVQLFGVSPLCFRYHTRLASR